MYNERYEHYKKLHPEWSEDQIKAAVSIDMSASNVISKEGKDVSPNDPDIIKSILEGARDWLKEVLPDVFSRVSSFFDKLITSVGEWVQKGLAYAINAVEYLYEKGKTVIDALKTPINSDPSKTI